MGIVLVARPSVPPMDWEEFCKTTDPYAVALDGYVKTGPRFDPMGPRVNFNHHEEVDRLATRATCEQVLMALRQGFFDRFRNEHGPRADVYVNDCDQDVCTSVFLLKHSYLALSSINMLLNRLVNVEGLLDATAGAYPFPRDMPLLAELAWVFEPYTRFRVSGEIDRNRSPESFTSIITDVEHRIMQYIAGHGKKLPIDTQYTRIGGGVGWTMIRELGAQARTGAFADGIRAYVAVRERPDGRYSYTVGRMSPFIPFDVEAILEALSVAEGLRWGGGNTIGGSPRAEGSRLTPEEVTRIVNEVLALHARAVAVRA